MQNLQPTLFVHNAAIKLTNNPPQVLDSTGACFHATCLILADVCSFHLESSSKEHAAVMLLLSSLSPDVLIMIYPEVFYDSSRW